ncbi:hypothetical protein ANO11243_013300 [Dothideomycetidae sp. 11243]|nr:hypothetical protein ANO11243_013300 [fungal sp. No.11243]
MRDALDVISTSNNFQNTEFSIQHRAHPGSHNLKRYLASARAPAVDEATTQGRWMTACRTDAGFSKEGNFIIAAFRDFPRLEEWAKGDAHYDCYGKIQTCSVTFYVTMSTLGADLKLTRPPPLTVPATVRSAGGEHAGNLTRNRGQVARAVTTPWVVLGLAKNKAYGQHACAGTRYTMQLNSKGPGRCSVASPSPTMLSAILAHKSRRKANAIEDCVWGWTAVERIITQEK